MSERRIAQRQKSFLRGCIYYNNRRSATDCLIRDISQTGARLIFSDAVNIPDMVDLYIPQKEQMLRAQVDRMSSRQLLDQEQYEQKLEQILRRQSALESRANALNGLGDVTGSVRQGGRSAGEPRVLKPGQANDKGAFRLPPDKRADPRSYAMITGDVGAAIARLTASLDRVEQHQATTLTIIEDNY